MKISSAYNLLLTFWILSLISIIYAGILLKFVLMALNILIFLFGTVVLVKIGLMAFSGNWENNVDLSVVSREWVKIPKRSERDEEFLWGAIYKAKDDDGTPKPYVITAHGAQNTVQTKEWFSVPIALNGFHVLAFNQSGHGDENHRSPGDGFSYPNVMVDVHDVVIYARQLEDIQKDSRGEPLIGFVGHSTGGLMALTQAYLNESIKIIISMSSVHDFMELVQQEAKMFSDQWWFKKGLKLSGMNIAYTEEENRIISPKYCLEPNENNKDRVFLIQAEDDVLPIEGMRKNQQLAEIPDRNCLFLHEGRHGFRSQETIVVSQIIKWCKLLTK